MTLTLLLLILAVSGLQITLPEAYPKKHEKPGKCPAEQKRNTYDFSKAAAGLYSIFINVYQVIIISPKVSSLIQQVLKSNRLIVEIRNDRRKRPDLAEMLGLDKKQKRSNEDPQKSINESLPPGAIILSANIQQISGYFYILVQYKYNDQYFVALIDTGLQVGPGYRSCDSSSPILNYCNRPRTYTKAVEEACLDKILKNLSVTQVTAYKDLQELNRCTKNNYATNWAVLPTRSFFDIFRSQFCSLF